MIWRENQRVQTVLNFLSGRAVKNRYRQLDQKKIPVKQTVKKIRKKSDFGPSTTCFPGHIIMAHAGSGQKEHNSKR
ncbi:hypothetical protein [Komagataeibacter medellinensis]|uniref:hypothetical protein n=1 Tax=Komagataeibacter medellinensis TaxID=1177712 RepID=UPI0011D217B0|nr:hypothetical protein [Komagataeibacter medellinensis]